MAPGATLAVGRTKEEGVEMELELDVAEEQTEEQERRGGREGETLLSPRCGTS